METSKQNVLMVEDDTKYGDRRDTSMNVDKGAKNTVVVDMVCKEDDSTGILTQSIGQSNKHHSGKTFQFLSNNTLPWTEVPASRLMIYDDDAAASLGADDRDITMPISQTRDQGCMKEEDISPQPTMSGGEVTESDGVTKEEVSIDANEVRNCVNMRGGRCKVHGEGARRVFKPRRVTVEGL